jgi:hypothetical protein
MRVISHPLFLLVVGGILTSLVIPAITRRWQDHQKHLELKVDLLGRVSDAVTRVITYAWWRELGGKGELSDEDRKEFNWAWGEWQASTRILQAQFEAYFRETDIPKHWECYCALLEKLQNLAWQPLGRDMLLDELRRLYERPQLWRVEVPRARRLPGLEGLPERTQTFSAEPRTDVDWTAFVDTRDSARYMAKFPALKEAMEAPRVPLTQAILASRVVAF